MTQKKSSSFRLIRIIILLTILVIVGFNSWQGRQQTAQWITMQWVVVYPVNADNSEISQGYIDKLQPEKFIPVADYLNQQARRYGVSLETPFIIDLAPQVDTMPPVPPAEKTIAAAIWYSLKLRYYAFSNNSYEGPPPSIKIYVNYFEPEADKVLAHSLGLEKGKIGIVNGFASWQNTRLTNVIIAHEILHTVGATDKYDMVNKQPYYPQGYADPQQVPLLPQSQAEIMGAAIVINSNELRLPTNLWETTVGELTAQEINWSQQRN